jgi:hypothetical protein
MTPTLSIAIARVLLDASRLCAIAPASILAAETETDAIRIGGNGPALAAWVIWRDLEALRVAWEAAQDAEPERGHSADRPT